MRAHDSADWAGREAAIGCGGAARVFLHGVLGLRVAPTLDGVKFEPVAVRFFDVEHFNVDRMPDQIARPFQGAFVRIEFVRSNCGRLDVFVSGP